MKTLIFLSLIINFNTAFSQHIIDVDNAPDKIPTQFFYISNGNVVSTAKYIRVTSGSPYFSETWMKGTVYLTDSMVAKNVLVRLDLLDGSLIYMNEKNEEMTSALRVSQLEMVDTVTGKKYVFIPSSGIAGASDKTWYQVLAGKKITLLKDFHKNILESKAYASSITEQEIRTSERYFIMIDNSITKVKKFSDITGLTGNKTAELQEYIDKNNLNVKKEADLISLVDYCNTLK